jgi:hypothetical protein
VEDYVQKIGSLFPPIFNSAKILVFDYCGELITEQSALVADALHQTEEWVDLSRSLKKDLGFVIQRAQRPISFKYWFFRGNLESFTMVRQVTFTQYFIVFYESLLLGHENCLFLHHVYADSFCTSLNF